eukprot:8294856-Pyramimonas_sp.AAC.1
MNRLCAARSRPAGGDRQYNERRKRHRRALATSALLGAGRLSRVSQVGPPRLMPRPLKPERARGHVRIQP